MNKSELIEVMADKAGMTKAEAGRALDAFTDGITEALSKGDDVALVGFGSFVVRERAARTARNPRTGDPIEIKASKKPVFRAGKQLKIAVDY